MAQVAFCSQINTKHINMVWAKRTGVECVNLLLVKESTRKPEEKLDGRNKEGHERKKSK